MTTKQESLNFRSAGMTSEQAFDLTNRFFDEGLLKPGDYFHEMYLPYFVITHVEYDPAHTEFGGVVWYHIASFFPLQGCGHSIDEVTHPSGQEKLGHLTITETGKEPRIWLYRVSPKYLRDRISYNSPDMKSFVADLTLNWDCESQAIRKLANTKASLKKLLIQEDLVVPPTSCSNWETLRKYGEMIDLKRANIELTVKLLTVEKELGSFRKKIKALAED